MAGRRDAGKKNVRLFVGAQSRFDPNEVYESPDKPGSRNSNASIPRRKKTAATGETNDRNLASGRQSTGKNSVKQKNTMWVKPVRDPKTGKVIRKGYLAYRNNYEPGHIKDKSLDPKIYTGQSRRIRRGDPVTGDVVVQKPSTTYLSEKRNVYRGGTDPETRTYGSVPLASYVGGKNINSPTMKKRLSLSVADRTAERKNSSRKKK
jgi:hypothetical protein